jgi:hypothetical protein
MLRAFSTVPLAAVVWLAGCAIHPLPDDVTGVTTYNIVRQIRCEARQAIFDFAVDYLTGPKITFDEDARTIGLQFKEHLRPIHEFNHTLFKPPIRQLVQFFSTTGIAYNFQLQILETDNIDPMTDLLTFNGKNQFSSPVSGNADRMRQNIRMPGGQISTSLTGHCADATVRQRRNRGFVRIIDLRAVAAIG